MESGVGIGKAPLEIEGVDKIRYRGNNRIKPGLRVMGFLLPFDSLILRPEAHFALSFH